jgi:hypothetical protein
VLAIILGIPVAVILWKFPEAWKPGAMVVRTTLQDSNGHLSTKWTISANRPIGIRLTTFDPDYSLTLGDGRQEISDTTMEFTVGDREGLFFWDCQQQTNSWTEEQSISTHRTVKSISFGKMRHRGFAPPGTVLGTFRFEGDAGQITEGRVTLVTMTPQLVLHRSHRRDPPPY